MNNTLTDRQKYIRKYYQDNKDKVDAKNRAYTLANKDKIKEYAKKYHTEKRAKVLNAYGNKCVCCGESHYEFLAIDHIDGKGNQHRKSIPGKEIHRWLILNNFPKGFQILCHNCNMAKYIYKKCPHQK